MTTMEDYGIIWDKTVESVEKRLQRKLFSFEYGKKNYPRQERKRIMATKKMDKENRCVDGNGRLVIPSEMRARLGLTPGAEVDFHMDGQQIILRKYCPGCVFCGGQGEYVVFEGKRICVSCHEKIKAMD